MQGTAYKVQKGSKTGEGISDKCRAEHFCHRSDSEYCSDCGNDKRGFKQDDTKSPYVYELLKTRLQVIEQLMGK